MVNVEERNGHGHGTKTLTPLYISSTNVLILIVKFVFFPLMISFSLESGILIRSNLVIRSRSTALVARLSKINIFQD